MSPVDKKKSSELKLYHTKKMLDTLQSKKGFHTELISLYVPPGRKIYANNHLKNEVSESQNIKSKLTRKNVIEGIGTLINQLKNIKELPENGLVMFSGAIPETSQGTEKREIYLIDPPEPVKSFYYHCASEFFLEPLITRLSPKETYGLLVIGRKESAVGYLRGAHMELVREYSSGIHGKHKAGGQSQKRFERQTQEAEVRFYRRISEDVNELFLNMEQFSGIFVGGPGGSKVRFVNDESLDYRLRDKILDVVDLGYSAAEGLRALVEKVKDQIENVKYVREKRIFQRFMKYVTGDDGLSTYGLKQVEKALEMGAVETLILSEKLDLMKAKIDCANCDYNEYRDLREPQLLKFESEIQEEICPKCNSNSIKITENTYIIEYLGAIAETMGTEIEIISADTEEGETLYSTFGGIVAILRFKTSY